MLCHLKTPLLSSNTQQVLPKEYATPTFTKYLDAMGKYFFPPNTVMMMKIPQWLHKWPNLPSPTHWVNWLLKGPIHINKALNADI